MKEFIYVEYPDKVVKFDICKNYGIDKELKLGEKPIPKKINLNDIYLDYYFLLKLLPLELWVKIFEILHFETLLEYKKFVGCDIEYNIHRLFKKRNFEETYRNFEIKINISPTIFQFYSTMYNEKDIQEYYGYSTYICNDDIKIINDLSDYVRRFTKCKCIKGGLQKEDSWGLCFTTNYDSDFVFIEGFNSYRIIKRLRLQKEKGSIKTFKTVDYYRNICKETIDNFYNKKNRIRYAYGN